MYLDYYYYPADLVQATDPCQFSNKYKYALAYLSAAVMAQNNELYSDATAYMNLALARIRQVSNNETPGMTSKKSNNMRYTG
jgi:hypothetical protein